MLPGIKLDRSNIKPCSREEHQRKLDQFFKAQQKLEERCRELGIPVPVMVC